MTNILPQHPYEHVRCLSNLQEPAFGRYPRFTNTLRNGLQVLLYARREDPVLQQLDDGMEEQGSLGVYLLVEPVRRDSRVLVWETWLGVPPCSILVPAMKLD